MCEVACGRLWVRVSTSPPTGESQMGRPATKMCPAKTFLSESIVEAVHRLSYTYPSSHNTASHLRPHCFRPLLLVLFSHTYAPFQVGPKRLIRYSSRPSASSALRQYSAFPIFHLYWLRKISILFTILYLLSLALYRSDKAYPTCPIWTFPPTN